MLIFVYIFPESSTVKSVKFRFKLKTISKNTRLCGILSSECVCKQNRVIHYLTEVSSQKFTCLF